MFFNNFGKWYTKIIWLKCGKNWTWTFKRYKKRNGKRGRKWRKKDEEYMLKLKLIYSKIELIKKAKKEIS